MTRQFTIMQSITITFLIIMTFIVQTFGTTASRLELIFIIYTGVISLLVTMCIIMSIWCWSTNKPLQLLNAIEQWILGLIVDSTLYWLTMYPLSEFLSNHADPVLTYRVVIIGITVISCIWFERYLRMCKDHQYGTSSWQI